MSHLSAPTAVRYRVLALACTLSMLTYLDRVCFGAAGPQIVRELGLTSVADLQWAFWAFAAGYGLFEIPTGWWGDRFGVRNVLIRVVLWWSLFTALTGLVGLRVAGLTFGGLMTLTIIRFLFGAGEAGAFPNIARALHNWFPAHERGKAQGWVWMSGRLMGGLTPLVWMLLVSGTAYTDPVISWRGAFALFGLLGVVWCIVFARRFRNLPADNPAVNAAEREQIDAGRVSEGLATGPIPWRRILFSRSLVCLYLMYFGITYGWYFNLTYLPACLETRYGVEPTSVIGSLFKGGPLWLGAVGCLIGGYGTDALLRGGMRRRWARRLPGLVGVSLSAVCYLVASDMPSAWSFALAISLAAFFNDLMIGSAWACCQDIGGRYTAIVCGCLNTASSLGAAAAAWLSGMVLKEALSDHATAIGVSVADLAGPDKIAALAAGYQTNLLIFAAVTVVSALMWLGVDAERPVQSE